MMVARGRSASSIRTPLMVRAYLSGEPFPGEDGDVRIDPAEGDYVARIHQAVKRQIRELDRHYQYPRRHSFQALVRHLITLGLVEVTGQREEPRLRGAGRGGSVQGFSMRTWVRLAPGARERPEWADPIGFIAQLYPNVRPRPAEAPAVPVPTPPARPARPRRPRAPREPAVRRAPGLTGEELERRYGDEPIAGNATAVHTDPNTGDTLYRYVASDGRQLYVVADPDWDFIRFVDEDQVQETTATFRRLAEVGATQALEELEMRRRLLVDSAGAASAFGADVSVFRSLAEQAESFLAEVTRQFGRRSPLPADTRRALDQLKACTTMLAEARLPTQREVQLNNCQAWARLLADSLATPLAAPPARQRRVRRPRVNVAEVWDALTERIRVWQRPNAPNARRALERFLEGTGVDREVLAESLEKLDEYEAEPDAETRAELWQEFLDALDEVEVNG